MMCGSTEKPENEDVRQFARGERVRWVRDADEVGDDVQKGAEGTVDEPEGHTSRIPWVELDDGRRVVANGLNLELVGEAAEPAPAFTVGQKVRVTGVGGDHIHHSLKVGEVGEIVDGPEDVRPYGTLYRVRGTARYNADSPITQYVGVGHLEVVEESLEPAVGATVRITGNTNPRHGYPVGALAVIEKEPDEAYRPHTRERYAEAWYLREKNGTLHQHVHAEDFEVVEAETPAVPKKGDTVELLEDYSGLKKGARGTVVRAPYGYFADRPLVGVDFGGDADAVGVYARRLRVVPAQPEPLAAALAHIPPRHVLGTWDATPPETSRNVIAGPEFPVSREATVEVFGEPTTEEVDVASWLDFREGDVIVSHQDVGTITVRREVLDVPASAEPGPGTFGTAVVDGERRHGVIDEDGDFDYKTWDGEYLGNTYTSAFSDFQPYSDAPALPSVEVLAEVLRETSDERGDYSSYDEDAEAILRELRARG